MIRYGQFNHALRRTLRWKGAARACLEQRTPWVSNIHSPTRTTHSSPTPCRQRHEPRRYSNATQQHKQTRAFHPIFILGLLLGGTAYYLATPSRKSSTLNSETFIPYTITSREAISPTSVILTIAPHHPDPSPPYLLPGTALWRHTLWSVEFKQPEVQIARHYTPLPPLHGEDPADGRLRFHVRAIGRGEMSNYLSRLGVGRDVWLRGPHAGFDVLRRLGSQSQVVFLAGGTGLVPAMQVAKAVLDSSDETTVRLLWAVRKREEVQSCPAVATSWWNLWAGKNPAELPADLESPSHVAAHLREMKALYGDRLSVRVAVDEEGTQFRERDIRQAITAPTNPPFSSTSPSQGCLFHDQQLHEKASEFEKLGGACLCPTSNAAQPGKNLFMISGPDGFVSHYSGPKVWLGGTLTQGPVGGVAAQLQRRCPSLASDWLILKL
ncbi:Vacuolar amino acid transporter 3 [Tolypocladium capitatum]|uniref:Vacuolar amino acid transporter 3 n=1 Tax=Tolypocladium capitatum TaxID=45235 RepID=A0A2K3QJM6_9HYPO|nr:Vacuolar amino acid transporter 3 [Tolypocladium capitatum]